MALQNTDEYYTSLNSTGYRVQGSNLNTVNGAAEILVNRGTSSHRLALDNVETTLQDTDQLLVNRGGQSYSVTGALVKEEYFPTGPAGGSTKITSVNYETPNNTKSEITCESDTNFDTFIDGDSIKAVDINGNDANYIAESATITNVVQSTSTISSTIVDNGKWSESPTPTQFASTFLNGNNASGGGDDAAVSFQGQNYTGNPPSGAGAEYEFTVNLSDVKNLRIFNSNRAGYMKILLIAADDAEYVLVDNATSTNGGFPTNEGLYPPSANDPVYTTETWPNLPAEMNNFVKKIRFTWSTYAENNSDYFYFGVNYIQVTKKSDGSKYILTNTLNAQTVTLANSQDVDIFQIGDTVNTNNFIISKSGNVFTIGGLTSYSGGPTKLISQPKTGTGKWGGSSGSTITVDSSNQNWVPSGAGNRLNQDFYVLTGTSSLSLSKALLVTDYGVNLTRAKTFPARSVDGYYPLYRVPLLAAAVGDGTYTTYTLGGITYYMPNGVTQYLGNHVP